MKTQSNKLESGIRKDCYSFSSFEEIVAVYYKTGAKTLNAELDFFRELAKADNIDASIKAQALLTGSHERYLNFRHSSVHKNNAINALVKAQPWTNSYEDFECLYADVCKILTDIPYIKDLVKYDVAKRIGVMLTPQTLPEKYVYIHNGTKLGASRLLGRALDINASQLKRDEFIPYFGDMSALHIENILCIMKDYFITGGIEPCESKKFSPCYFNYDKWLLTNK